MSQDNDCKNPAPEIAKVGIKAPPFWKPKPALWFAQMEAQFKTNGISVDETKYNYVIQAIETEILCEVSDIVTNPPVTDKYETLKNRLVAAFEDSEEKRLRTLLNELELGDRKPSQLLRQMRDLAAGKVTDNILKSVWMQRLPSQVQAILATSADKLDQLAQMADRVAEICTPSICNVSNETPNRTTDLQTQVTELSSQLQQLRAEINSVRQHRPRHSAWHMRDRSRSRNRHRSRAPTPNRDHGTGSCWYHRKFGAKAKKCEAPCTYLGTNQVGN